MSTLAKVSPAAQQAAIFQEALGLAMGIDRPWLRVRACAGIAPRLPAAEREQVLHAAFEAMRLITHAWLRGRALQMLAHNLPHALQDRAVEWANAIETPYVRALALSAYSARLSREQLREVLGAAPEVIDEWLRFSLLLAVAPYWPRGEFDALLAAAQQLQDHVVRVVTLNSLAQFTADPAALRKAALAEARGIEVDFNRAEALAALLSDLPSSEQEAIADEAWRAAQRVEDEALRLSVLTDVLACCADERRAVLLAEGLALTERLAEADGRAEALSALIRYRSPGEQEAAVEEVLKLWT